MDPNSTTQDADDVDVKSFIMGLPDAPTPEKRIESVKNAVRSGKVFFYPASGFDWEPILDLHQRYSTFIYCDWAMKLEDFTQGNHAGWQASPVRNHDLGFKFSDALPVSGRDLGAIEVEILAFLTPEGQVSYRRNHDAFANPQPWGRLLDVVIHPANLNIQLVFLCAEGVTTYLELFSAPRCAPEFLSIKGPGTGFGYNYTDFRRYDDALGRAVQQNPSKPTCLGADQKHDWPWTDEDGQAGGMTIFKRRP
jgi:hypothetical protein